MRISDWSSDVCSSDLVWRLMRVGNEFISWRAGQPVYLKVSLATLHERLEIFSTTLWAFEMGRFRSAPLFRTRLQRDRLTHFRQSAYLVGQRSDERRVGKARVSTWRSGWSTAH